MKILLGGVRGTSPRTEAQFQRYGGHTTSLLVTGRAGAQVLLDAGSGIHVVHPHLAAEGDGSLLVLLTHLHLDHLIGLPVLSSLFRADVSVEIVALAHEGAPLRSTLETLVSPPLWPLRLAELPATVITTEIPLADAIPERVVAQRGDLEMRAVPLHHPDGGTAWRVDEPATGAAVVLATDVEWGLATPAERDALLALCRAPRPAELLVMDGHFTDADMPGPRGWGHSTIEEAVDVARTAGVARLLITHHAPENDDARLDTMDHAARALWSHASLARQGETIELGG